MDRTQTLREEKGIMTWKDRIKDDRITLDYGSGGLKTSELIESILLPAFDNTALSQLGDGAVLGGSDRLVFSTDSFVVSPWKFPGGDIGKLSVCGTVNDLCMAGGTPKYLSLSFILEEGFSFSDFKSIVSSIAEEAKEAGVSIVTGDTKVVDSGKGDGIYINTAGIGFQRAVLPGKSAICPGDAVLISGTIGCHGAAVMMARSGLLREGSPLVSDCQPLHRISAAALEAVGNDCRYACAAARQFCICPYCTCPYCACPDPARPDQRRSRHHTQ